MSNRTVGTKRGSVRGAPPEVYMGFCGDDDPESWKDAITLVKQFSALFVLLIVLYTIGAVLWAVGIVPDEWAE